LRDVWLDKHASSAPGAVTVDALSWLSKATLDIIGLAGFNYSFNALRADPASPNELSEAFDTLYHEGTRFEIGAILATYIPPLRVLVRLSLMNFLIYAQLTTPLAYQASKNNET
jgi:hypothetical protein